MSSDGLDKSYCICVELILSSYIRTWTILPMVAVCYCVLVMFKLFVSRELLLPNTKRGFRRLVKRQVSGNKIPLLTLFELK